MTINIQTDENTDAKPAKKMGRPPKEKSVAQLSEIDAQIASGNLVRKEDIDAIISEELEKARKIMKAGKEADPYLMNTYKQKTRITDEGFIKQLMKWQISVDIAADLQNKDKELSREKLWEYIRKVHRAAKK